MSLLNYIYKFDYSQIIKNVFYYLSITIFEISIKLFEFYTYLKNINLNRVG